MSARYAVIGNPVAHSRSPEIHAAFAAQTGEDIGYESLFAQPDAFAPTATRFFAAGGLGMNVTLPFKIDAFNFVDEHSAGARAAGAVNTIRMLADGRRAGDNTDGRGLVRDLIHNRGVALAGRRILLLGAGGAARGAIGPLLREHPAAVVVANRTVAKARALTAHFAHLAVVTGIGFELAGAAEPFDLVINATAAGLAGDTPPLPARVFAAGAAAYDMLYADEPTAFLTWARACGIEHAWDGFGMLVEQAAESFCLWRGVRPATAPVIAALRPAVHDR